MLFFATSFLLLLLAAIFVFSRRLGFVHGRRQSLAEAPSTVTIGVFHPYANGGGGGERVLYCAVLALADYFKAPKNGIKYSLHLVLYSGDDGLSAQELLERGGENFNLPRLSTSCVDVKVTLVPLPSRDTLEPSRYPRFTLFWQGLAQIRLALEAFEASAQRGIYPQLFLDTLGSPFSYVIASWVYPCVVACYTHFPMISSHMITKVYQRGAGLTNTADIAGSSWRSGVKYVYYRIFAWAFGLVGKYCTDVAMVNSTWTYNHVKQMWGKAPVVVYPPCGAMNEYLQLSLQGREPLVLSVSQFRPEKNHLLQLEAFHVLLTKHRDLMQTKYRSFRLVLLGSCRDSTDENRVAMLKKQAARLGIADRVDFVVDASFAQLKQYLAKSSIGIHTMYNEHFGISNVEMMAAGMILIANNSGGPKADIVKPGTGYLALTAEEYADKMLALLEKSPEDVIEMRAAARAASLRFSDEEFCKQFTGAMTGVLESLVQ